MPSPKPPFTRANSCTDQGRHPRVRRKGARTGEGGAYNGVRALHTPYGGANCEARGAREGG